MKKVCVVGLGYVGLPTASLLAIKGYSVNGVDVRSDVVHALNEGKILIYEPGLKQLVQEAVASEHLHAATTPSDANVFILVLPTPFTEGKKPDLTYVLAGVKEIAPFVKPGNVIILESTSPVGTSELICQWLHDVRPDLNIPGQPGGCGEQIYVAHCPERVLPGRILQELVENDRIVGGVDQASTDQVAAFYRTFVQGEVLETNARTAELAKLVENSFRDVNIAFANELSLICDKLSVDVWETIGLANRHPRVDILNPGTGVGGHCISVDPWFVIDAAPEEARLIRTARETNDRKAIWVYERIVREASTVPHPIIACLGLAFKPNIDDLRESPALQIAEMLAGNSNITLLIAEPYIRQLPKPLQDHGNVRLVSQDEAIRGANIIAVLTGHESFSHISLDDLRDKKIIDGCGLFVQKRHQ